MKSYLTCASNKVFTLVQIYIFMNLFSKKIVISTNKVIKNIKYFFEVPQVKYAF